MMAITVEMRITLPPRLVLDHENVIEYSLCCFAIQAQTMPKALKSDDIAVVEDASSIVEELHGFKFMDDSGGEECF